MWFPLSLRKCRLKKNQTQRRTAKTKGRQVLPVGVSEERLENLSCLFPSSCFLFYFVLSALNSPPPPPPTASRLPIILLLPLPCLIFSHLSLSLPIHLSFPFMCLTPPLSFNCLSFCHFAVPSLFPTPLSFSLPLQFRHSTSLLLLPPTPLPLSAFICAHSEHLRRGDAPVPEWRDVLPEPEVHLSSGV